MIVDDYQIYRKEIGSMAVWGDITGFIITDEASNGQEALIKLQQKPVDLLLTDIKMPFMDGLELLKRVTEEKLCRCVILMSQFSDFEYARQGLSNGAFEYLLKPVDPGELMKALQRASSYISERSMEISKISYLDKILNEKSEIFFPDKELDNIIHFISEGSLEAMDCASYLVDFTYSEIDFDIIKTANIINKSIKKIIDAVQDEFPWIAKFFDLQELKLSDFTNLADISLIKESFVAKVDAILTTIRKYELGIENSNMVRTVCKTILENIDTDITVNEISNRIFITRTYLSQVFKEKTGTNLVKYITDVKIERAKVLIANGIKSFEISEILGYKDDEYFKKLFKKTTGLTINEYRSSISN
jgi:two-component system response regulator YesN